MLASLLALLALPPLADGPDPDGATTKFDVRRHGFNFVNYFEGDVLIDVPLVGRVDFGDTSYGLCGGMSFSAADTFFAGGAAPDYVTPPNSNGPAEVQPGTKLRGWLYDRQTDTFKAQNAFIIRRTIAWSWRPDEDVTVSEDIPLVGGAAVVTGLYTLMDDDFKSHIAPELDRGNPIPLCLINADLDDYLPSSDSLTPEGFTKNHQVLAIGYRFFPKSETLGKHWAIDVYDPNYPDEVHTLHYDQKGRVQTRRVDSDGRLVPGADDPGKNHVAKFRAFFATPYEPKVPYWVASSPFNLERLSKMLTTAVPLDATAPHDGHTAKTWRARQQQQGGAVTKGQPRKSGSGGGGLDGLKTPDVKASEGDTATAIRGKPDPRYDLVDCPERRHRLGRIVVRFPECTPAINTEVAVLEKADGPKLTWEHGDYAPDLVPGSYGLLVGNKSLGALPVEARKDTVVKIGALRVDAGETTQVEILDSDQKTKLAWGRGTLIEGLPPGKYFVRLAGQTAPVDVVAGKVTEF